MCLTEEFFEYQSEACEKYEKQGYTPLNTLIHAGKITVDKLFDVGFIKQKEIFSTAEVREWEVSFAGEKYLKEYKRAQLIMVKPGKLGALLKACK